MSFSKNSEAQEADSLLKEYGRFIRNYKVMTSRLTNGKESKKFIQLQVVENPENISMIELLDSENKLMTKVLIVFFHLSKEARKLIKHSKIIANKLTVIEDEIISVNEMTGSTGVSNQENALVKFSYALEDLVDMKFVIQNTIYLSVNVFQQYCALFSMDKLLHITPTTHFPSNLDDVLLLFGNLMTFDIIFKSGIYKTYLEQYNSHLMSNEQMEQDDRYLNLQNTLHELDLLLDGNIFQIALDNIVAIKERVKAKNLKMLENFMLSFIKNLIYGIGLKDLNISELSDTEEIIKLNIAVVLYQRMFDNLDVKHLKLIENINSKYPAIILHGNVVWNGNEFLKMYLTNMEKANLDLDKLELLYLKQKVNALQKDTVEFTTQVRINIKFLVVIFIMTCCLGFKFKNIQKI